MSTRNQFPVLINVDITETIDSYLIEADIAGFRAENVKVSSWQDTLVIEMQTTQESSQSYYLGELESECYRRVIPLGFNIKDNNIHTKYSTGTLSIFVDKPDMKKNPRARSKPSAFA
ncbi:MAG: Hsp20/alpha crystallin family protein [Granulosicoccus sp.]